MPAQQVRSDHEQLKQGAQLFQQEAESIEKMLQNLNSRLDALKGGGWKGKGATQFFREMDSSILPSTKNLNKALAQAARITNQISQRLRQAEQDCSAVLNGSNNQYLS
jgi:WXG100 family type VII secretion target